MSSQRSSDGARVLPLRPVTAGPPQVREPQVREPLWRHVVGGVLRGERRAQQRTLKDVADAARISMPYLSEVERGRKEASSEVLAAAAEALGLGLADVLALVQGELARARRVRAGVRPVRGRGPASAPAGPAGPAAPAEVTEPGEPAGTGAVRPGSAAAGGDDGPEQEPEAETGAATAAATSVTALRTPPARTRTAPPHHGDVRLAA